MKITEKVVYDFLENGLIRQEEYALYYYCFDTIFSNFFYYTILLFISILLNQVEVTIAYYVGFLAIRYTSGGYHVDSQRICFLLSIMNYVCCLGLIHMVLKVISSSILFGMLLINFFLIWKFAPVDHPNKRFSLQEEYSYRKKSKIAIGSLIIIIFVLWNLMPLFGWAMAVGCMSATTFVMIAKK